ncbi:endosialidase catalytic beta-propeller domain-containing protein [Mannheimia haemolytica]|nr:endosialidase catalytic beta-propeller domain-containing protein [Mannheimia haemolytica]
MKQVMNPINTPTQRFKDGDPSKGEYGTIVTAQFLNDVQDGVINIQQELHNVLADAGIEATDSQTNQVVTAIKKIAGKSVDTNFEALSANDGFKFVGQAESVEQLLTLRPTEHGQRILVKSYHAGGTTGGGEFVAVSANNAADNGVTYFASAAPELMWQRVYTQLSVYDAGFVADVDKTAMVDVLERLPDVIDGMGLVINVNRRRLPTGNIRNVAYRYNGIEYCSADYMRGDVAQITRTGHYTAWTQDKAFVHENVIYAPFMLGFRHGYDDMRIAWTRSFDGGATWDSPTILVDYHAQNPTLGYHCFSMGVVGNRLFMLVEERNVATEKLNNCYLYSRPMTVSRKVTGGIRQQDNRVTVTLENHGLFVGDYLSVTGSGIVGVSGETQVTEVIDANTFVVRNNTSQTTDNTTQEWRLGISFERNQWSIQELGKFERNGHPATHIHSFSAVNNAEFLAGFHYGDGQREVGFLHFSVNWSSGRAAFTQRFLPDEIAQMQSEPCIKYVNGKVYMTTRSQSPTAPSLFVRCDITGQHIESFPLTQNAIHYSPLPFVMVDDVVYLFGTERAENEWETEQSDKSGNRYRFNRPRTMLMKFNLSDFGHSEKVSTQCVYQGIYAGESGSSACGVGSVIYYNGKLFYLFGDEDARNSHSQVENAKRANQAYIDAGYQPEIYCLRLTLSSSTSGIDDRLLRGADNLHLPVFRGTDGIRTIQCSLKFEELSEFVALKAKQILATSAGDYAMYGTDFLSNVNRLYLSSSHKANASNGSLIIMHNEKSSKANAIEYKGDEHIFSGVTKLDKPVIQIHHSPAELKNNQLTVQRENDRSLVFLLKGSDGQIRRARLAFE